MEVTVRLGDVGTRSVSATIYGLVDRGVRLRPDLAAGLQGRIAVTFAEDFADVLVEGSGGEIVIADRNGAHEVDLEIHGSLADFVLLVAAPLAKGLPKPTDRRGRAALARIADGRIDFIGSLNLARRFLQLLSVSPEG
jgi:hypothetical protein